MTHHEHHSKSRSRINSTTSLGLTHMQRLNHGSIPSVKHTDRHQPFVFGSSTLNSLSHILVLVPPPHRFSPPLLDLASCM
ncbi:Protein of unknown function [Pyronema omphalodes CBS 100304]|uniref:Uncharacterized protein n=1 Tax=Pyronema omphalodes (strain CBS 100304) TaxID=1076935 RepID=U4LB05_PYROM|nr:Protein of unknown function [Pyronema omphalodes CBS 100304]